MTRLPTTARGRVGRFRTAAWLAAVAAGLAAPLVVLPAATGSGANQAVPARTAAAGDWIQLFNGRDLTDWTIKFTTQDLGVNLRDTFRVEDGLLKVRYDKWQTFDGEFGHIFYKQPFSYYRLAAEYRFVGDQVAGGPDWARRNNGLMLHAPDPKTMTRAQDFPISIEVQLLGGLGNGRKRSTANLCTPATHVVMKGALVTTHCVNSTSRTYDGDQWVRVEVEVHGDELIQHIVDGQVVLEYTRPQIGGGEVNGADPAVKVDGTPLTGGYIALQAETAPIDFRKVELLDLEGCTDPAAANYKPYYLKSNPARCRR
jgi:3-keto-disaccharide hydrolase